MAYTTIDPNKIKVGDAITKELLDIIKANFTDHETRLGAFESSVKVPVLESLITLNTLTPDMEGFAYYTATHNFTLVDCVIQIFEVNSMNSALEIDVQKSSHDLDDGSFTSIFTTKPKITMASASDYDRSTNQVFNGGQVIVAGDVLRFDLSTIPTNKTVNKFLLNCYGEI